MKKTTILFLLLAFLGYCLAFAEDGGNPQPTNQLDPKFYYPSDPEYRVVSYSVSNSRQDVLTIDIYGNGRVLLLRPAGYLNPGSYETEMSNQELEELLTFLADRGVMRMTSQDIVNFEQKAMSEAAAEGLILITSSEAHSTIRINLDRYISRDGEILENIDQEISFGPIGHIVRSHPDAAGIRELNEVVQKFMALKQLYRQAMEDQK